MSFAAILAGAAIDDTNATGVWQDVPGAVKKVLRGADLVPGDETSKLSGGDTPFGDRAGYLVISSAYAGAVAPGTAPLLVAGRPGDLTSLVRAGDPVVGLPAGVAIEFFDLVYLASETVALGAPLQGAGVDELTNSALFLGRTGNLRAVAIEGDPAPELPAGLTYGGFGNVVLNSSGSHGFTASLRGPGVTLANDQAFYRSTRSPGARA